MAGDDQKAKALAQEMAQDRLGKIAERHAGAHDEDCPTNDDCRCVRFERVERLRAELERVIRESANCATPPYSHILSHWGLR